MKTKSYNNYHVTGRLIADAKPKGTNDNCVAFTVIHHVGKEPLFVNCVLFANKGTKYERPIPTDKLVKGNLLDFKGYFKPVKYTKQDGSEVNGSELVVTTVSEPELAEDSEPEANGAETEQEEA